MGLRDKARKSAPPQPTSLELGAGRTYGSGYEDAAIERMAVEDGGSAVHDRSLWGDNGEPRVIEMINAGADAVRGLIGHAFRGQVLELFKQLAASGPKAQAQEQQALADLDAEADALAGQEHLKQRIVSEGLVTPDLIGYLLVPIGLVMALVFGDLSPIATGFQLFGLSDTPMLGIPLFDELHLAASASVFALMALAHFAADNLAEVLHDLNRQRKAAPEERDKLPPFSWTALVRGVGWIVLAIPLMLGLVAIRGEYLASQHIVSQSWTFLAIQVGIFTAALAISLAHAHPYGRDWAAAGRAVRRATRRAAASCALHVELVAHHNGLIAATEALLAQAGHHVAVSVADARRQGQLYPRRVQLSQPEPVTDRLFPKQLPRPTELSGEALAEAIVGLTELPPVARLDTSAVNARRAHHRAALEALRTQTDVGVQAGPASARRETYEQPKSDAADNAPEVPLPDPPGAEAASANGGTHA